jgi:hypothetical protein
MLDPGLGRWMGVDPKASSLGGMSPYQSMGNNPVLLSDPDGDFIPLLVGAAIGMIGNGVVNSFNNQPFFSGWGESAFFGAFSAGAASSIGGIASGFGSQFGSGAFQAGAHGVVNGAISYSQGGTFGSGLLSGSLSSVSGSFTANWGTIGQYGIGATTDALGSAIGGGNFWVGATTGTIVTGLNHLAHQIRTKINLKKINGELLKELMRAAIDEYASSENPNLKNFIEDNYFENKGGGPAGGRWLDQQIKMNGHLYRLFVEGLSGGTDTGMTSVGFTSNIQNKLIGRGHPGRGGFYVLGGGSKPLILIHSESNNAAYKYLRQQFLDLKNN